jgi:hypothetical protein
MRSDTPAAETRTSASEGTTVRPGPGSMGTRDGTAMT